MFINCGGTLQIVRIWYINGILPQLNSLWIINPGLTLYLMMIDDNRLIYHWYLMMDYILYGYYIMDIIILIMISWWLISHDWYTNCSLMIFWSDATPQKQIGDPRADPAGLSQDWNPSQPKTEEFSDAGNFKG